MGKIKKILETELIGGTQNTDVYPITSVKAVYDEKNERLDSILNRRMVNISTEYNDDHIVEELTLSQAINKVPSGDRVVGFCGLFLGQNGWNTYQYIGDTISTWSDITKWVWVSEKYFYNLSKIANNYSFESKEEARRTILTLYPRGYSSNMFFVYGLTITYRLSSGEIILETYKESGHGPNTFADRCWQSVITSVLLNDTVNLINTRIDNYSNYDNYINISRVFEKSFESREEARSKLIGELPEYELYSEYVKLFYPGLTISYRLSDGTIVNEVYIDSGFSPEATKSDNSWRDIITDEIFFERYSTNFVNISKITGKFDYETPAEARAVLAGGIPGFENYSRYSKLFVYGFTITYRLSDGTIVLEYYNASTYGPNSLTLDRLWTKLLEQSEVKEFEESVTAKVTEIQDTVNSEVTERKNEQASIKELIKTEESARVNSDNNLQTQITEVRGNSESGISEVKELISTEIADRKNKDEEQDKKIQEVSNDLAGQIEEIQNAKNGALSEIGNAKDDSIKSFHSQKISLEMLSEPVKEFIQSEGGGQGIITNFPDDFDITSNDNKLSLKDRISNSPFSKQGVVILRPENQEGDIILTQQQIDHFGTNTIFEIRYDFNLNGETITFPAGTILRFNGGKLYNGSIIGQGLSIEAGMYQIFENVKLSGNFTCNFYVEWWGASSSKDHNEIYINNAINSFPPSLELPITKRLNYSLLLLDRYEINDTIYVSGNVSLLGKGIFSRARYYAPESLLIVNFSDQNKWIIDSKYKDGTTIPYNVLHTDNGDNLNDVQSFNISGLHFQYKEESVVVYGGIRLSGLIHGKISDIDMSCGTYIGMALLRSNWNLEIRNVLIYAIYAGLYLGPVTTTVTLSNVYILQGSKWGSSESPTFDSPTLLDTSLPPYTTVNSVAIIMEGAAATFYGCIIQEQEAMLIGTDYNAYFSCPYVEQIKKTFAWLYSTKTYGTDTNRKQLKIDQAQLGIYSLKSYGFGTVRGRMDIHDFMYATCYTPTDVKWDYPSYFIHIDGASDRLGVMYYDDFVIDDDGNVTSATKSKYKQIIVHSGNVDDDFIDVYIRNSNATKSAYAHRDLVTGFSDSRAVTSRQPFIRGYNKVRMTPVIDNIPIYTNNVICENKHLQWKVRDTYAHQAIFGEAIRLKDSQFDYIGLVDKVSYFLPLSELAGTTESYHEIYGECKITIKNWWSINNGVNFVKLCGDKPINLIVDINGKLNSTAIFSTQEGFIQNPNFEYPYNVVITWHDESGTLRNVWRYTNIDRPTLGLYKGYSYFDSKLNKMIYWNGDNWLDYTGNIV